MAATPALVVLIIMGFGAVITYGQPAPLSVSRTPDCGDGTKCRPSNTYCVPGAVNDCQCKLNYYRPTHSTADSDCVRSPLNLLSISIPQSKSTANISGVGAEIIDQWLTATFPVPFTSYEVLDIREAGNASQPVVFDVLVRYGHADTSVPNAELGKQVANFGGLISEKRRIGERDSLHCLVPSLDPCVTPHSECVKVGLDFICRCMVGYREDMTAGGYCVKTNVCSVDFCGNGGTCYLDTDFSRRCLCSESFSGDLCENVSALALEVKIYKYSTVGVGVFALLLLVILLACTCRDGREVKREYPVPNPKSMLFGYSPYFPSLPRPSIRSANPIFFSNPLNPADEDPKGEDTDDFYFPGVEQADKQDQPSKRSRESSHAERKDVPDADYNMGPINDQRKPQKGYPRRKGPKESEVIYF